MATQISKNFSLEEFIASDAAKAKGINNTPSTQVVCRLCALVHHVVQPLRDWYGKPIEISSGYRSTALNKAVGGVANSQHLTGEACDLQLADGKNIGQLWFDWIRTHCEFDQLIMEHNAKGVYWVHVSYRSDGKNRKQVICNMLKK